MAGYWHANYWHANYWHANYWAPTGEISGDYWVTGYWHANYWHANYWALFAAGSINVTDVATRSNTPFVTTIDYGPDILASTGDITVTPFSVTASLDIDPSIGFGDITRTAFNPTLSLQGYIAGDIDVQWFPASTIELTYGVNVSLPTRAATEFAVTAFSSQYTSVAASGPANRSLLGYPVIAQNNVAITPLIAEIEWDAIRPLVAGQGLLIPTDLAVVAATGIPAIIVGTERDTVARPGVGALVVTPLRPAAFGIPLYTIPDPTFPPDDSIENAFSGTYPSSYEICDRTGFRQRAGELKEEWTGALVRDKSWERRNIQDFVRGVGDEQEGSPRPEQEDEFVWERYPGGVTADDL